MADNPNQIKTIHRRQSLARITSGAISTLAPITHIAFGSGGTTAAGKPIPPSPDASGLNQEIARYPIDSVTFPVTPQTIARYTVTIPDADLVGAVINEASIVDSGGGHCGIMTFLDKGKDEGASFTFIFDDEFR